MTEKKTSVKTADKKTSKNQDNSAKRYSFSKFASPLELPYLIEIQKNSFDWLLGTKDWQARKKIAKENHDDKFDQTPGIEAVINKIFPVVDKNNTMEYSISKPYVASPKMTPSECIRTGKTYSGALYVKAYFVNKLTGEHQEKTIGICDEFPLMTDRGTFVFNGTERSIVSQLHRSPGISYTHERDKQSFKELINCRIIPEHGSWLEFGIDKNDKIQVQIDRKKKLSIFIFLIAIGVSFSEMTEVFQDSKFLMNTLNNDELYIDYLSLIQEYKEKYSKKKDLIDKEIEEKAVADANNEIRDMAYDRFARNVRPNEVKNKDDDKHGKNNAKFGKELLDGFYFNPQRYSLSRIGRYKINQKLGVEVPYTENLLTTPDFLQLLRYLVALHENKTDLAKLYTTGSKKEDLVKVNYDDIDHLSNRRVRQVGELIQQALRTGLLHFAKYVQDKMGSKETMISEEGQKDDFIERLTNPKTVTSAIKAFFGLDPLSQILDQNNPLSALSHRRRLSSLGNGGLTRDRAAMEVRDVHPTHYGRICPIESPEGANIGLIGALASYARINGFGFIETPYRKVVNGRVTDEIEYLSADEENKYYIAQANQRLDKDGKFIDEYITARNLLGEAEDIKSDLAEYIDISPSQMVSIGTSLIPFLEHDDANRALMGANMQRQAVPLVRSFAPFVGTGVELRAAKDTGDVLQAYKAGTVTEVDSNQIVIKNDDGTTSIYNLRKFVRTNQSTCFNQTPRVKTGDKVKMYDILADGSSTKDGELALGANLLVAFMNWDGYNFEDAIIINERLVKDDILSTIIIEEHEILARDTKNGEEEITRDIPGISEEALANLDEDGVIRVGAQVNEGDILVGRVTPRAETRLTPEEKILQTIFDESQASIKSDTSLRMPHGESGVVVGVDVFKEDEVSFDLPDRANTLVKVYIAQKRKITPGDKLSGRHGNKGVISKILPEEDMPHLADGTPVDIVLNPLGVPSRMNLGQVAEVHMGWAAKYGWDIKNSKNYNKLKEILPEEVHQVPPNSLIATPVFDGCPGEAIQDILECVNPNENGEKLVNKYGKAEVFDGRTGEKINQEVTVGYMYIIKLHHLVEDKIHARSTGPYSAVTQQPLGGKAQEGGQRFGEMEVWALEGYGASRTLNEILTIKSDSVNGRSRLTQDVIYGRNVKLDGITESYKLLNKEIQAIGLNIENLGDEGEVLPIDEEITSKQFKNIGSR